MKYFVLLLITLVVANSFPLENEENAALEKEILGPHTQDTGDLRMQPNIPMIETPLNDPAQQSDWDGNVDWSPRDVNVGGRNENGKRGWKIGGSIGKSNGRSSWGINGNIGKSNGRSSWGIGGSIGKSNGRSSWGINGNIGKSNGRSNWGVGATYRYRFGKRGLANNAGGKLNTSTFPAGNHFRGIKDQGQNGLLYL